MLGFRRLVLLDAPRLIDDALEYSSNELRVEILGSNPDEAVDNRAFPCWIVNWYVAAALVVGNSQNQPNSSCHQRQDFRIYGING